jgi:hypothetical protein
MAHPDISKHLMQSSQNCARIIQSCVVCTTSDNEEGRELREANAWVIRFLRVPS